MELDSVVRDTIASHPELQAIEASLEDDELRHRLITDPKAVLGTERLLTAEVKRFAELLIGDPLFRKGLADNPAATTHAYGLTVDPAELRALWDSKAQREGLIGDDAMQREGVRCLNAFNELKRGLMRRMLSAQSSNTAFDAWRRRQIARCGTEVDPSNAASIVHAPATFELAAGCSVGCWFCGISAEQYRGAVSYAAIRSVWLDTIQGLHDVLGPIARNAFLYWGTEPFDNPDYEKYCLDLKRVCGGFPQTTTAIPMRDPDRTWETIKLSTLHGCPVNRFSILTPRTLRDTLARFSATQLLFVELVLQNRGSLLIKADAGKARNSKRLAEDRKTLAVELAEYGSATTQAAKPSTIACVSGFLFNLARRELRLISPCAASDANPDGYLVFEKTTFADGAHAVAAMRDLIARHMRAVPEADVPIAFRTDLSYARSASGFVLHNAFDTITIQNPAHAAVMQRVGDLIRDGGFSVDAISSMLGSEFGIADAQTQDILTLLFNRGLLRERVVPQPAP